MQQNETPNMGRQLNTMQDVMNLASGAFNFIKHASPTINQYYKTQEAADLGKEDFNAENARKLADNETKYVNRYGDEKNKADAMAMGVGADARFKMIMVAKFGDSFSAHYMNQMDPDKHLI